MPGPTPWEQVTTAIQTSTQAITTNTETVIATLSGVNSRSPGAPVYLIGTSVWSVQGATTTTTLRIRIGGVAGTLLGQAQVVGSTAGSRTGDDGGVAAVDTPAGEYAGQVYVLTIQAANAGANWNVTLAALQAVY